MSYKTSVLGEVFELDFSVEFSQTDIDRIPTYRLIGVYMWSKKVRKLRPTELQTRILVELRRRGITNSMKVWSKYIKIFDQKYDVFNSGNYVDESCVYVHPDLPHSRYKKVGN